MFEVGQKVRFVGRPLEMECYHKDYEQLFGQIGTVVSIDYAPIVDRGTIFHGMDVRFEGFQWSGWDCQCSEEPDVFVVFANELEPA